MKFFIESFYLHFKILSTHMLSFAITTLGDRKWQKLKLTQKGDWFVWKRMTVCTLHFGFDLFCSPLHLNRKWSLERDARHCFIEASATVTYIINRFMVVPIWSFLYTVDYCFIIYQNHLFVVALHRWGLLGLSCENFCTFLLSEHHKDIIEISDGWVRSEASVRFGFL